MINNRQISEIDILLSYQNLTIPQRKGKTVSPHDYSNLPDPLTAIVDKVKLDPYPVNNEPLLKIIDEFCEHKNISLADFYRKSDLSRQCMNNFNNLKFPKRPNRNSLISILFALELPINDVIFWMNDYDYSFPSKNSRDQILVQIHNYMINQPSYSIRDINEYLYKRNAPLLSQNTFKYD